MLNLMKEDLFMGKTRQRLKEHTIVCGYGMTGQAAVNELIRMGVSINDVVIIDNSPAAYQQASDAGFIAIKGDASREAVLDSAKISVAKSIIVSTSRDDTNVLICLTARNRNSNISIAAAVKQKENLKLIKSSGAKTTVVPSMAGGHILAASTRSGSHVNFLEDLLTTGGRIQIREEVINNSLCGKQLTDIEDRVIISLKRAGKQMTIREMKETVLETGDSIVFISETLTSDQRS
jgi:voltage-gated potassium channel